MARPNAESLVPPEVAVFTHRAIAELEGLLWREPVSIGCKASDEAARELQQLDQRVAEPLRGTDTLYIGHSNREAFWGFMYQALLDGAGIVPELARAYPHNYLSDEISELCNEHPDLYAELNRYGYRSQETPVAAPYVGAYVLPKAVVIEVIETLHERGRSYQELGWGFPYWSDQVGTNNETERREQ